MDMEKFKSVIEPLV